MLYIRRNQAGEIVSLTRDRDAASEEMEKVYLLDDEVIAFLQRSGEIDAMAELLFLSDNSMARVVEDLIDLLIQKNIILFTDLPAQAQRKIEARRHARQKMNDENFMVDDIL